MVCVSVMCVCVCLQNTSPIFVTYNGKSRALEKSSYSNRDLKCDYDINNKYTHVGKIGCNLNYEHCNDRSL